MARSKEPDELLARIKKEMAAPSMAESVRAALTKESAKALRRLLALHERGHVRGGILSTNCTLCYPALLN
jgi:hypothetical protein